MTAIEILRLPAVEQTTGLRKSAIYEMIQRGEFPKQIMLTKRAVGWSKAEVQAWLEARAQNGAAA